MSRTALVLISGMAAAAYPAEAQTATNTVLYTLNKNSSFEQGCFPPCLCPVMIGVPVTGTFLLIPTGFDGLYNTYAVSNVNWVVSINGTNMTVTGSGTYRLGGEVALQQELSLDLELGGGAAEHFDSGLVAESVLFPDIKVAISMNHQICFDTVFNVEASALPVPQVQLAFAGTNKIVLSWPVSGTPFVLQESDDLTLTNWTTVTNAVVVREQQNQVVLPRPPGNRFYRLQPKGN